MLAVFAGEGLVFIGVVIFATVAMVYLMLRST